MIFAVGDIDKRLISKMYNKETGTPWEKQKCGKYILTDNLWKKTQRLARI